MITSWNEIGEASYNQKLFFQIWLLSFMNCLGILFTHQLYPCAIISKELHNVIWDSRKWHSLKCYNFSLTSKSEKKYCDIKSMTNVGTTFHKHSAEFVNSTLMKPSNLA